MYIVQCGAPHGVGVRNPQYGIGICASIAKSLHRCEVVVKIGSNGIIFDGYGIGVETERNRLAWG